MRATLFSALYWAERRQWRLTDALGQVTCQGDHNLIFDGEPQAVEAWWRCPKCGAAV